MTAIQHISVVIPNYNHAQRLRETLTALRRQRIGSTQIEVIVIDNGSTDGSPEVAVQCGAKLHVITNPQNPFVCRNFGLQVAAHPWIALLDATCVPCDSYLEALVETQQQTHAALVVGNFEFQLRDRVTIGEMVDSLRFMRNSEYAEVRDAYPSGTLFFHRSLIGKIGLFREDLRSGADLEWSRRIYHAGERIVHAPNAQVLYQGTPYPQLMRKAYRDGWGQGTLIRETGLYHWSTALWSMRPPGIRHFQYILHARGMVPRYRRYKVALWFGLWWYRICFGLGKMHLLGSPW